MRLRATPCEWCGSVRQCDCERALDQLFEASGRQLDDCYAESTSSRGPRKESKEKQDLTDVETTSTSEGSEGQEADQEQETSQGEDGSLVHAGPARSADDGLLEEKDWRVRELRSRLSDLLGAPGSKTSTPGFEASAEARRAVTFYGGEGACLRRFLKSVGHDIGAAEQKLRKTIDFRVRNNVSTIRDSPAAQRIWEELYPHWPEYIIGTTHDGSPVSYFDIEKAVAFCQRCLDEDKIRTFWIMWMEHNLQLQRQGRAERGGGGGFQDLPASVVVYNLSGLSLARVTKCAKGLAALVRVVGLAEEHYPENLRKAIIINVPSLFYNFVWPLVTKVLNTETLANITISDGDGRQVVEECDFPEVRTMLQGVLAQ